MASLQSDLDLNNTEIAANFEVVDSDDSEEEQESFAVRRLKVDANGDVLTDENGPVWEVVEESAAAEEAVEATDTVGIYLSVRTTRTDHRGRKTGSDVETHVLPPNYVFDVNSLKVSYISRIGSENWIRVTWSDYVEILPGTGLKFPTKLTARAHARSKDSWGVRGSTKGRVFCKFTKYK